MADIANNRKGFFPASPDDAKLTYLPVAASQTLAAGDAVIISSGKVAIALANSAELCGVCAQTAASLAAGTMIAVWADPNETFIGRMDASTSYVMGDYPDLVGATGAMQLDADASATDVFVLLSVVDGESAGAGQRWRVKINKHAFADTST